jgi:hypothetical protein
VPFLAGTYDERMYEELRLRAQTFEVLTDGEVSVDNAEGRDDVPLGRLSGRCPPSAPLIPTPMLGAIAEEGRFLSSPPRARSPLPPRVRRPPSVRRGARA